MNKNFIKELFDANRLDEAVAILDAAEGRHAWALYMLGRIAWKRGDKGAAITFYERAVDIDVASEAAVALEQARSVMSFFNKDLLNP